MFCSEVGSWTLPVYVGGAEGALAPEAVEAGFGWLETGFMTAAWLALCSMKTGWPAGAGWVPLLGMKTGALGFAVPCATGTVRAEAVAWWERAWKSRASVVRIGARKRGRRPGGRLGRRNVGIEQPLQVAGRDGAADPEVRIGIRRLAVHFPAGRNLGAWQPARRARSRWRADCCRGPVQSGRRRPELQGRRVALERLTQPGLGLRHVLGGQGGPDGSLEFARAGVLAWARP